MFTPKATLTATCFYAKSGQAQYINYGTTSDNKQLRHRKSHASTNL